MLAHHMRAPGEMDDRARALQRAVERGVVGRRKITDGEILGATRRPRRDATHEPAEVPARCPQVIAECGADEAVGTADDDTDHTHFQPCLL